MRGEQAGRAPGAWRIIGAALALAATVQAPSSLAQSSSSFRSERIVLAPTVGETSSAGFRTRVVLSEPAGAGGMASACGTTWVQTTGFLSILAMGPVPIQLQVERASSDPVDIRLSWTGTRGEFEVRRVFLASEIGDPSAAFATVSTCDLQDPSPTDSELIFYRVVPAATPQEGTR